MIKSRERNTQPIINNRKAELTKAKTSQKAETIGFLAVITLDPEKIAKTLHVQNKNCSI